MIFYGILFGWCLLQSFTVFERKKNISSRENHKKKMFQKKFSDLKNLMTKLLKLKLYKWMKSRVEEQRSMQLDRLHLMTTNWFTTKGETLNLLNCSQTKNRDYCVNWWHTNLQALPTRSSSTTWRMFKTVQLINNSSFLQYTCITAHDDKQLRENLHNLSLSNS